MLTKWKIKIRYGDNKTKIVEITANTMKAAITCVNHWWKYTSDTSEKPTGMRLIGVS